MKDAPATLPANFNFGGSADQSNAAPAASAAPATLPANFNFNPTTPTPDTSSAPTPSPATSFINETLKSTGLPKLLASGRQLKLQVQDLFSPDSMTPDQKEELSSGKYGDILFGGEKTTAIQNPLQAMGTGAQLASMIVPLGPEAKGASWITNLLREATPFAVTQTLGTTASDLGEGKSAGAALGDAAMTAIGSYAGLGLFKGLGTALKATAGVLMKSDVVKAANQSVLDFMNHALSLDGRFAQTDTGAVSAKDAALQTKALEQAYEPVHKEAMDAFAQSAQRPTSWDDVYRGVQNKVSSFFDKTIKAKDAKYAEVFRPDFFPSESTGANYGKPTFEALDRAKASVGESAVPADGKMSVDQARSFLASGGADGEVAASPVSKYVDLVESKLGTPDAPKSLSMKDFDDLFTSAPVSKDPIENKQIQDIATSVYQSAKDALSGSTDPEAKNILKSWESARTQWQNVRSMAGTRFADNMKNIGDSQEFVEKMMTSKPTVPVQKIIDGLDADTKAQMSDIIYNMALQRSRTMNSDYAVGGKNVEKMLDNWSPTGLITPQHEMILRSYADAMQGTYDDAAQQIQKMMGGPSDTGTALDKAAAAQSKLQAAQGIEKAMGGKPLYTMNDDGSLDFTNLKSMVDKINKDPSGDYGQLAKYLNTVEDLNKTSSSKVGAVVKGIFGATMFHQHPFVGLGLISTSLESLFGKNAAKITTSDISRLTTDLIKTGRLTPDKTSQFLINMIQGNFKEAGGILAKLSTGTVTKTAGDVINPNPNE